MDQAVGAVGLTLGDVGCAWVACSCQQFRLGRSGGELDVCFVVEQFPVGGVVEEALAAVLDGGFDEPGATVGGRSSG